MEMTLITATLFPLIVQPPFTLLALSNRDVPLEYQESHSYPYPFGTGHHHWTARHRNSASTLAQQDQILKTTQQSSASNQPHADTTTYSESDEATV